MGLCIQTWDLAYLPISVNAVFDRYGFEYNVTAVLTPDLRLDQEAYAAYSPMYFPSTYTAIYALAFALATSSLVHTILYYGPTMWQTFRDIKKAKTDIHAKLMSAYPDVPTWWYAITFVACAAFSIGFVEVCRCSIVGDGATLIDVRPHRRSRVMIPVFLFGACCLQR